jgi:hypothetical protein
MLLYFEPGINTIKWPRVIEALKVLHPKLTWASRVNLDSFNPFEAFDPLTQSVMSLPPTINGLTIDFYNKLSYGRFPNPESMLNLGGQVATYSNKVVDGWEYLGMKQDTDSIFDSLDESYMTDAEHVEHFYQTGKLLNGTYYFDPPLIEPEIRKLHNMFGHIKDNKVILNPLRLDVQFTGNYNMGRTLLWLDVHSNKIDGWQNVEIGVDDEDGSGEYDLNNLAGIKRWCQNNDCYEPFRDGRLFLTDLPNTEDIFNQLNESDEFDWVDISTDSLSGQRLYDTIQNYFSTYHNDRYWLEEEDGVIQIWDDTGIYYDFKLEDFTIPNLIDYFKDSMTNIGDPEVKEDYIQLAKTLESIIGPINF